MCERERQTDIAVLIVTPPPPPFTLFQTELARSSRESLTKPLIHSVSKHETTLKKKFKSQFGKHNKNKTQ